MTYCHDCWKAYQEKAGLVDVGCIFPQAEVCSDRDPVIIQFSNVSREQIGEIKNARCYRGHKSCMKHSVEDLLFTIKQAMKDEPSMCPNEGCGRLLKKINTKYYTTMICPVHGVILKAIIGREE